MSIFYVYMKWYRASDSGCSTRGRLIVACESRYVADELFRALTTVKSRDGKIRYNFLDRKTPQFWSYDTTDSSPWHAFEDVLGSALLPEFGTSVMPLLPHEGRDSHPCLVIPIVIGPDWVHNGSYFIRNKRQPDLYWYHLDGNIHVSRRQKTKFRISGARFEKDDRTILIRSDLVEICPLEKNVLRLQYINGTTNHDKLSVSGSPGGWRFGDFLGGFGTIWEGQGEMAQEFVTWTSNGKDGDEWELC